MTAEERFWRYVEKGASCWLWIGSVNADGYGRLLGPGRKVVRAHRLAYELLVGPIPEGLTIDHLCRIRNCVNPEHLEPVTNQENLLRGIGIAPVNAAKTHCPRGHEYTPENTTRYRGGRFCLACRRERNGRYRADHLEEVRAYDRQRYHQQKARA